jgi:hypothetical protein
MPSFTSSQVANMCEHEVWARCALLSGHLEDPQDSLSWNSAWGPDWWRIIRDIMIELGIDVNLPRSPYRFCLLDNSWVDTGPVADGAAQAQSLDRVSGESDISLARRALAA